jgi:cell wall-associated NlpC family hydrolase
MRGRAADLRWLVRRAAANALVVAPLLATACASTGATPHPFPTPGPSARRGPEPGPAPATAVSPADTYAITGAALALRGVPYRNGGEDPTGFDCSGFTRYVFGRFGIALPRAVADQFAVGTPVPPTQLASGDLLFFSTVAPGPTHVAIALGGDEFIHAPSSSGVVRVEHLSSAYWSSRFIGARRVAN